MDTETLASMPITFLYVPGIREDRIAKALSSGADVVIVDLEDSVSPSRKAEARSIVARMLSKGAQVRVQVRVNAVDTPWNEADLEMVEGLPLEISVRAPKVSSVTDVEDIAKKLRRGRAVHCLLETAQAIEAAFEIASVGPPVASIGLGEADLKSDLGISEDWALDWARARVVCASRAAGLGAPVQSVHTNIRDLAGLVDSTRKAKELGFLGRCALHPRQLTTIRQGFAPDDKAVQEARAVLSAMEEAEAEGSGIAVLENGSFVDVAMIERARKVLAIFDATRSVTYPAGSSLDS